GEDIEITPIYGKLGNETIIAGYEKKKRENPTGPGALSLDNVKIKSFKIIDVANGNKEIDYKVSDDSQYNEYSSDPTKFSSALCEGQNNSIIKLQMELEYKSDKTIIEGDTLEIPVTYGGFLKNFSSQILKDGTNKVIGTWEYKNGNIIIKFSGDYIRNNQIKSFGASFETGEMMNYNGDQKKSFNLGERYTGFGKLGKNDLSIAIEKVFVKSKMIGTTHQGVSKLSNPGNDSHINWEFSLKNDSFYDRKENKSYTNAYMLEHDGLYNPNSRTGIYIEDTFSGGVGAPKLNYIVLILGGINDEGKVVSSGGKIWLPISLLAKKEQGNQTREEVKQSLQSGEYCIYKNGDETYTLMLKWWDMNDGSGITYNQVPQINDVGGVGSWLKKNQEIYKDISTETVEKMNRIYDRKALQNIDISIGYDYIPVKEVTTVKNTAKITTNQTGEYESTANSKLTPPAGIADAPSDPLTIKLIKSDRNTGRMLSAGFNFELQTSKDNGSSWTKVDVEASDVEIGTHNSDNTVTPNDKGIVQIKKLIFGQQYRFVEKTHAAGYYDVEIDNANPNSTKYPKSANSKAVTITNQGKGQVIAMYNAKPEKVEVAVSKKWIGPETNSVTIKLLADGKEVVGKTLTLDKQNKWTDKFKNLEKYNPNGSEIKYDVAEVKLQNYESKKEGNAKTGFTITNKNIEKISIPVEKKWEGEELD
ncbi:Cna B-type domain-containing protein, partial [Peptostreptococcus canis]